MAVSGGERSYAMARLAAALEANLRGLLSALKGILREYGAWEGGEKRGFGTRTFADGGRFMGNGEWTDGVFTGKGSLFTADGQCYEGDWVKSRLHGKVKLTLADGRVLESDWKDGKMVGQGLILCPDGDRYEGDWKDNAPHGQGTFIGADGERYVGFWAGGLRNGKGVATRQDGRRYEGEWEDGSESGRGTERLRNGERYEGEWRGGARSGEGGCRMADGSRYTGAWADGKRQGQGRMAYAHPKDAPLWADGLPIPYGRENIAGGGVYEGEWRGDLRDGFGRMRYADGSVYEGRWAADHRVWDGALCYQSGVTYRREGDTQIWSLPNGDRAAMPGPQAADGAITYTFAKGHAYTALWENGVRRGPDMFRLPDGEWMNPLEAAEARRGQNSLFFEMILRYEGGMDEKGARSGKGRCTFLNGRCYIGGWLDGVLCGEGTMFYEDGGVYAGEWVYDRRHGEGRMTYPDGTVYDGPWVADLPLARWRALCGVERPAGTDES